MSENKINNCDFLFKCPLRWEDLQVLENGKSRFCHTCSKDVHIAHSEAEFNQLGSEGKCVAINLTRNSGSLSLKCDNCGDEFNNPAFTFCLNCGFPRELAKPKIEDFSRMMTMGIPLVNKPQPKKTMWGKVSSIFRKSND